MSVLALGLLFGAVTLLVMFSGMPIAEHVAGLDPAMAANSAQVKTLAMPRPPGMRCIQACIAR